MAIGYHQAKKGDTLKDAIDVGDMILSTSMLEPDLEAFYVYFEAYGLPLVNFTPEWWIAINETIGQERFELEADRGLVLDVW